MDPESEVVQGRESQSNKAWQAEQPVANGVFRSSARKESLGEELGGRPNLVFKDSQQLGIKLGMAFALLIVVLLGTGYWSIGRVARINRSLQDTLGKRSNKLQLAHDGLRYSSENSRITMQLFLQKTGSLEALLNRRAENTQKISDVIRAIESQSDSEQEKQLLLALKETRTPYVNSYLRALDLLLKQRKTDMAEAVMVEQTTPALFAYHAAWNDLVSFEMKQMRMALEQSEAQYATTRKITSALVLLAGFLATGIAFFATRRTTSDAKARIRMHQTVQKLNVELEQRVALRTEELARTDEQLRGSLAELQEHTGQMEAINELVELLQSCLTVDEARQQAARVLEQFFAAGAVLMLNSSRNLLDVALSWGAASKKPGPFAPESCWAMRKGRVHLVQPGTVSLLCGHSDEASASCHLCVPMVAQGDSLGVLSIDDSALCHSAAHPRLLRQKQELATSVAEQISLAFANLRLRETLKYQSVRDALTGLFNRRHMEESLERELLRAARNAKPVTVLMVDVDHFKRFNDLLGHEAGDVLLRELGSMFNSQIRGGDIACRYGGEEFLLIMADTSLEAGCERAEKLREQITNLQIRHRGETLRRITASIGVAGFPEHGTSAAHIVKLADEALYQAKAEGRDRVVLAGAITTQHHIPALVSAAPGAINPSSSASDVC